MQAQPTIPDLVDRVDSDFSVWRVYILWIWGFATFLIAFLAFEIGTLFSADISSHPTTITPTDIALLAVLVAIVTLVITMLTNVITKEGPSWVIDANFRRLARKDPPPYSMAPVLRGLVLMKAQAPRVKLRDSYNLLPDLFTVESLLRRVYKSESTMNPGQTPGPAARRRRSVAKTSSAESGAGPNSGP